MQIKDSFSTVKYSELSIKIQEIKHHINIIAMCLQSQASWPCCWSPRQCIRAGRRGLGHCASWPPCRSPRQCIRAGRRGLGHCASWPPCRCPRQCIRTGRRGLGHCASWPSCRSPRQCIRAGRRGVGRWSGRPFCWSSALNGQFININHFGGLASFRENKADESDMSRTKTARHKHSFSYVEASEISIVSQCDIVQLTG